MLSGSVVAIDVGSVATRVVWLKGSPGQLTVERAESYVVGESNTSLAEIVADLKGKRTPVGGLRLGASGQTATLRYNLLPPVPEWRLQLILKYEAEEMMEKSQEPLSTDYVRLDVPESESEDQILLVGLGKEEKIQPQIDEIESAGGRVQAVVPAAMGLFHAYRQGFPSAPNETVLLADVGAVETHVVVAIEGRLVFARSVNYGGNEIDETIASGLNLKPAQARKLKEGLDRGKCPAELEGAVRSSLRTGLGQLVRVLESSISFCRLQTKIPQLPIDRILLTGGTSKLSGVVAFVEETLGTPCEPFRPKVSGELPGSAQDWGVAIGLAASAFDAEDYEIDLLPAPAKKKREFRERTLFLYTAAAVLLVGVLVLFAVGFQANSTAQGAAANLARQQKTVQQFRQQQTEAEKNNERFRNQTDRIKTELATTTFQGEVLDLLRRRLPEAIALESVALERSETDGSLYYELVVSGHSDNSERLGIDHVDTLKQELLGLPRVTEVALDLGNLADDGTYPFTLVVAPMKKPEDKRRS